jgi:hypothetical protein
MRRAEASSFPARAEHAAAARCASVAVSVLAAKFALWNERPMAAPESERAREAEAAIGAYREVRADRRAFVLRPDRIDPRRGHK